MSAPPKSRIRFTPVQLKARHDGWTPERQRRFIEELAATRSISKACRAVGMSRDSAYSLRDRPEAAPFRLAWKQALEPDFAAGRGRSRRAVHRLERLGGRKADKVKEMEDPPGSPARGLSASSPSSASSALRALLEQLRAQEREEPRRRDEVQP